MEGGPHSLFNPLHWCWCRPRKRGYTCPPQRSSNNRRWRHLRTTSSSNWCKWWEETTYNKRQADAARNDPSALGPMVPCKLGSNKMTKLTNFEEWLEEAENRMAFWVPTGVQGPPTEIRSPQTLRSPQTILQCRSPNNSAVKVPKHLGRSTLRNTHDKQTL